MTNRFSLERYESEDFSVKEYMMYFIGLGEGEERSLGVGELVEKVPRNSQEVIEELEKLESDGYLESNEKGSYVTESKGFNEILEGTRLEAIEDSEVNESKYFWLGHKGLEYVSTRDLDELRPNIQYAFECD